MLVTIVGGAYTLLALVVNVRREQRIVDPPTRAAQQMRSSHRPPFSSTA
jgi:hypothetical protein